jgi:hypothetical protein
VSRQFDTTAGTDSITFAVGNAPPDQGPITVAVLAKAASTAGWTGYFARGLKSGSAVWSFLTSNNSGAKLFCEGDFGNGVSGLSTSWRWYVFTKASGSALPRFHVWDLSSAWAHTDDSFSVGDGSGPIDSLVLGGSGAGSNGWRGSIAMAVTWSSQLNDAAIEAALTLRARDALSASPGWMVRLNQASTATSVPDDTGGGGGQSAISGTSVDADDPPGFDYALSSTVSGSSAQTATVTSVADGTVVKPSTATQSVTVTNSAAATVLLGQTATQAVTVTSAATATVVHNATVTQAVTVTSAATPEPDAAPAVNTGNWYSLMGVYRQNVNDLEQFLTQPITECRTHGEPLEPGRVPGTLHCKFGGEVYDLHGNHALI